MKRTARPWLFSFLLVFGIQVSRAQINPNACWKCIPVSITVQPVSPASSCVGNGNVTFHVGVSGTGPFTYQWQENMVNLTDTGCYGGTQTATLTILNPPASIHGKFYRCLINNCKGKMAITNNSAMLTLGFLPSDFNQDGLTDILDFGLFLQKFNTSCINCPEDINQDGIINIDDFLVFLARFGMSCL